MYDMYPEWGPARHRDETDVDTARTIEAGGWTGAPAAFRTGADARDAGGQRPDDN